MLEELPVIFVAPIETINGPFCQHAEMHFVLACYGSFDGKEYLALNALIVIQLILTT